MVVYLCGRFVWFSADNNNDKQNQTKHHAIEIVTEHPLVERLYLSQYITQSNYGACLSRHLCLRFEDMMNEGTHWHKLSKWLEVEANYVELKTKRQHIFYVVPTSDDQHPYNMPFLRAIQSVERCDCVGGATFRRERFGTITITPSRKIKTLLNTVPFPVNTCQSQPMAFMRCFRAIFLCAVTRRPFTGQRLYLISIAIEHVPVRQTCRCTLRGWIDTNCSICLAQMTSDCHCTHCMNCQNSFHVDCLTTWQQQNNSCPLCRHPFFFF